MPLGTASLPDDLAAAHAVILAERAARLAAEARARNVEAEMSGARLEIERLRLLLARMRRERFGQSSERGARLIEQLELQLADLEESAAEEETAAEIAAPKKRVSSLGGSTRKPARRPLPENLPRERIVYPAPCACPKCGGPVRKLGEDVTETLECEPRRWKVVEHVREKVSCRACEAVSQPPAPSHPIARGRAGPNLLALVLAAKYGQHLPLTRQSAIYAREGVELDVSTLADWVGSSTASLMPLVLEVRAHVFAAERLHGDDTTVPILAKGKTVTGRVWVYVRDDLPFGGRAPPAALYYASRDRRGEHPARHGERGVGRRMCEEAAIGLVEPLGSVTGANRDGADRPGRRRREARSRGHRAVPLVRGRPDNDLGRGSPRGRCPALAR